MGTGKTAILFNCKLAHKVIPLSFLLLLLFLRISKDQISPLVDVMDAVKALQTPGDVSPGVPLIPVHINFAILIQRLKASNRDMYTTNTRINLVRLDSVLLEVLEVNFEQHVM